MFPINYFRSFSTPTRYDYFFSWSIRTRTNSPGCILGSVRASDGSNNHNRMFFDNRDAVVSTTTVTAVIFFNNCAYFKKFLFKKKFILPMLKFEL